MSNSDNFDPKELGFLAENIVSRYLAEKNYEIIDKNYRKPWGEIDIIAKKDNVFVFVEVKANRQEAESFEPELRADKRKLEKVIKTASLYLDAIGQPDTEWQIDVVSATFNLNKKVAKIKHFKNVAAEFF